MFDRANNFKILDKIDSSFIHSSGYRDVTIQSFQRKLLMESIFFPGNVLCTRFEMQARVKKENSIIN